jgi:mono/diheme cytochrome c family protein
MKKLLLLVSIAAAVSVFSNCSSTRKVAAAPASTYETHIQTMVMNNCSPCHIPAKGGNKKAFDNYTNVKSDIDEILRRIQLNPGEKGYMPFKRPKLSDSTINVFKQWKADGMLEK